VNLRRILAGGTVGLVVIAVLTACGFNYPTQKINLVTAGTDYRDGSVSVLNAAVVSSAGNGGTLIATLVNNTTEPAQLTGITATGGVTVEAEPLTIKPSGLVSLANEGGYAVTGSFAVGDFLHLTFAFGDGSSAAFDVPVVADADQWSGLDTAVPSASASSSAGS
jgi:hypothetical protein